MGAWLRRIVVSIGIGGMSYLIMLGIMVLSVVYDRELEPVVTYAFDTGRSIIGALDKLVSGSHWGQVAVNHLRERVNMTHVVLSIPAIIIATIVFGIPFNRLLGGTRTALQRISIALVSIPSTVVLAVVLFSFNALWPDAYAGLAAFRRLGVAGVVEWTERLRRYHSRRAQADQCRAAGLLGASLRHHGIMQHGGVVPGQCTVRACNQKKRARSEMGLSVASREANSRWPAAAPAQSQSHHRERSVALGRPWRQQP